MISAEGLGTRPPATPIPTRPRRETWALHRFVIDGRRRRRPGGRAVTGGAGARVAVPRAPSSSTADVDPTAAPVRPRRRREPAHPVERHAERLAKAAGRSRRSAAGTDGNGPGRLGPSVAEPGPRHVRRQRGRAHGRWACPSPTWPCPCATSACPSPSWPCPWPVIVPVAACAWPSRRRGRGRRAVVVAVAGWPCPWPPS